MNLSLSEEQTMLRDMLTRWLREHYDGDTRRARIADGAGHDDALWQGLAGLGVLAAPLPEGAGGIGWGAEASMIVLEALGEALAVSPYLETVVQGGGLLRLGGGAAAELLVPGIGTGTVRIAIAQAEAGSHHVPHDIGTRAARAGDGWRLTGGKVVVAGAADASHWIVAARTAGDRADRHGISLFLVTPDAPGAAIHPYRLIDERAAADLAFADTPLPGDALIGPVDAALPLIEQVQAEAVAGLCAEAVGVLRAMVEQTVDYTRQRRQFGRALAEFQVLQHRMVDMHIALEQCVSAARLATLHLASPAPRRDRASAAAKVTIARAARFIGEGAVQLHGAMGMTDELAVGHYFKRAAAIQNQFGSADIHLAHYAALRAA